MLLFDGFDYFNSERVIEAIREGSIEISNRVVMLFLYNNEIFAHMLYEYGESIQKELGMFELYTYYPRECIENWKNYPGELKVNRQEPRKIDSEFAYLKMEKIAESYGITKSHLPSLIIINSEDGRFIPYNFEAKDSSFVEFDGRKNYLEPYLRKMLKVIKMVQNVKSFDDLEKEMKKQAKDGFELFIFSSQIRDCIMSSLKQKYRRDITKKEDLVFNSLGIKNRNFNARLAKRENQPLMRDEVIAIAITLGLDIDKTNVLLNLSNYEKLSYSNIRDGVFMSFINRYLGKNFYDIMDNYSQLVVDESYMLNYLDIELHKANLSLTERLK